MNRTYNRRNKYYSGGAPEDMYSSNIVPAIQSPASQSVYYPTEDNRSSYISDRLNTKLSTDWTADWMEEQRMKNMMNTQLLNMGTQATSTFLPSLMNMNQSDLRYSQNVGRGFMKNPFKAFGQSYDDLAKFGAPKTLMGRTLENPAFGTGVGTVADIGGNLLGQRWSDDDPTTFTGKEMAARAIQSGGKGAKIGAQIGSVVPVVGTAIGTALGTVIGAGSGLFKGKKERDEARELESEYEQDVVSMLNMQKEVDADMKTGSGSDMGYTAISRMGGPRTYHAGGLYHNINHKKKSGTSKSKSKSTITPEAYSNMQKGFPKQMGGYMNFNNTDMKYKKLGGHKYLGGGHQYFKPRQFHGGGPAGHGHPHPASGNENMNVRDTIYGTTPKTRMGEGEIPFMTTDPFGNIVEGKKPVNYQFSEGTTNVGRVENYNELMENYPYKEFSEFNIQDILDMARSNWMIDDRNPEIRSNVKRSGGLKSIPAGNKGLPKLPTSVRNTMGYKKHGGMKYGMGGQNRMMYHEGGVEGHKHGVDNLGHDYFSSADSLAVQEYRNLFDHLGQDPMNYMFNMSGHKGLENALNQGLLDKIAADKALHLQMGPVEGNPKTYSHPTLTNPEGEMKRGGHRYMGGGHSYFKPRRF